MVQIVIAGRNRASDPAPDFWSSFSVGSILNSEGRQEHTQKINCRNLKTTLSSEQSCSNARGNLQASSQLYTFFADTFSEKSERR